MFQRISLEFDVISCISVFSVLTLCSVPLGPGSVKVSLKRYFIILNDWALMGLYLVVMYG